MKILHLIETLGRGGAEHLLLSMAPALRDRGHDCEVAVLWPPYDLAEDLERQGIRVRRLDIGHRWQVAGALAKLVPLVGAGYDVIHSHLFFAGFYAALASYLDPKARRVVTFHNCDYDSYPADTLPKALVKAANGYLMRHRVDAPVAISAAVAEHYARHLGMSGFTVLPNAVDFGQLAALPPAGRAAVLAHYGLEPDRFVVALPGRLVHEKGHRFLLEALSLLAGRKLYPQVLMVGDGPLFTEVQVTAVALGLSGQVRLQRALKRDQLLRLMRVCDAVAVPSTHEGFGMVALEAMALGVPVLAAAVGGLRDLVEARVTGLLVPPADPLALADALEELMENRTLREALGRAGQQRARADYDLTRSIEALEQVYQGRLTGSQPRTSEQLPTCAV